MGLLDIVKGAVDVVTTPFAAVGSVVGSVTGLAAGTVFEGGQWAFNKLFGRDADFDTSDIFTFSALGGKLGQFAGGFGAKFLLPGGLATGLLFGGLSLTNGWADDHVLMPILKTEAKLLGLDGGGAAAGEGVAQFPAICGPEGVADDGTKLQAIAVPLPEGTEPTGPTQVDPATGQTYQLAVVPAGACKDNVVTVTPEDFAKTNGMANALGGSQK